jgi:hypothetical protein
LADNSASWCVVGTDAAGQWCACVLNDQGQARATATLGGQDFETQVDPVCFACDPHSGRGLWIVASADGSLRLLDTGGATDVWNTGAAIQGVEVLPDSGGWLVILATGSEIQGWQLVPAN